MVQLKLDLGPVEDGFRRAAEEPASAGSSPRAGRFASPFLAGVECGSLGWNGHDLLATSGHLPGQKMARVAKQHHPDVRILTTDPITGLGERQFAATDTLVATGLVDVVGVNYDPHTARAALRKVLLKTWRRYRRPILVSETSWHDGHPRHHRRHPGFNKGHWLRHVVDEVAAAQAAGAEIAGICWYPIVDSVPWHQPRSRRRWRHGLIRHDLSVDDVLSTELRSLVAGRHGVAGE